MKISYHNTDVVYDWDDIKKEQEDPSYKPNPIHTGRFIQSLSIEFFPDREGGGSKELVDGVVLDYDKDGNVTGIEMYLLDMVMDEESLKEFDRRISEGVTVDLNEDL